MPVPEVIVGLLINTKLYFAKIGVKGPSMVTQITVACAVMKVTFSLLDVISTSILYIYISAAMLAQPAKPVSD